MRLKWAQAFRVSFTYLDRVERSRGLEFEELVSMVGASAPDRPVGRQASRRFSEIPDDVEHRHQTLIVTRGGKSVAAIGPVPSCQVGQLEPPCLR